MGRHMEDCIAYYRVSTDRQGASGLGLAAQRQAVARFIGTGDRLARNVAFIANLMESGVDFVAVDMPTANRLTIHILAAVAEHEREMISKRTKAALAEARRRGTKLGNPRIEDARALAIAA